MKEKGAPRKASGSALAALRARLEKDSDPSYARFVRSGLPADVDTPVLGLRMAQVRAAAKEFEKDGRAPQILKEALFSKRKRKTPPTMEERFVVAIMIGREKAGFGERLELVEAYLPLLESWATVDHAAGVFQWRNDELPELLHWIDAKLEDPDPCVVRLGLVILLKKYVGKIPPGEIVERVERVAARKTGARAVQMGLAWLLCEVFVGAPDVVLEYMRGEHSLDRFAFRQTVQKIQDSLRVDPELKEEARALTPPGDT